MSLTKIDNRMAVDKDGNNISKLLSENTKKLPWVSVTNFGAKSNEEQANFDSTQAFLDAITDARSKNSAILIPNGTFNISQQLKFEDAPVYGLGVDVSIIKFTVGLGTGVPSVIVGKAGKAYKGGLFHLSVKGVGTRQLGVKTANGDGIRIDEQIKLEYVKVEQFDAGIIFNAPGGHISLERVLSTNNYFGVYQTDDGGDYHIIDSALNGNTMAGFGLSGDLGMSSASFIRTHIGYQPYGIYQEVGATTNFLNDITFIDTRFELIGNGAIFTENLTSNSNHLRFESVGFNWEPSFKIASRDKGYAVKMGKSGGQNVYIAGMSGFKQGDLGSWYIDNNFGIWEMKLGTSEKIVVNSGYKNMFKCIPANNKNQMNDFIPSGSTSRTFTTFGYAGPTESVFPIITPTSSGGLSNFILTVTGVTSDPVEQTVTFTVNVLGGTPTSSLFFNCKI
ncbi:hypothetical protein [Neobacillus cucumis]|nr:hypothetical protein [Neobacillus cucumis]